MSLSKRIYSGSTFGCFQLYNQDAEIACWSYRRC